MQKGPQLPKTLLNFSAMSSARYRILFDKNPSTKALSVSKISSFSFRLFVLYDIELWRDWKRLASWNRKFCQGKLRGKRI